MDPAGLGGPLVAARYLNTLHGFLGDRDGLNVFRLPDGALDHSVLAAVVLGRAGVSAVDIVDSLGVHFLQIPLAERHAAGRVVQAVCDGLRLTVLGEPPPSPVPGLVYQGTYTVAPGLVRARPRRRQHITEAGHVFADDDAGYAPPKITLCTRLEALYTGGDVFSVEASEHSYLDAMEAHAPILIRLTQRQHRTPGLWKTRRGRAFAERIQAAPWNEMAPYDHDATLERLTVESGDECPEIDYPLHITPVLPSPPPADPPEDDVTECMVCMDAYPDTLVLPCMHTVVCRACSVALAATGDARTCLRCRRPIEGVLADGQ